MLWWKCAKGDLLKQWPIRLCYAGNIPRTSLWTESVFLISVVVFSGSTPSVSICPAFCCALFIGLALEFEGKFAWLPITIATHCKKCCRENERGKCQNARLSINKESQSACGNVPGSGQTLDTQQVWCTSHSKPLFYTSTEMLWQERPGLLQSHKCIEGNGWLILTEMHNTNLLFLLKTTFRKKVLRKSLMFLSSVLIHLPCVRDVS